MTTTTNLNIGLIDTNQSQKEVTANEAIQALENAITETLDVECTDSTGGNIVADDDYRECICLRLTAGSPGPATTVEVELPAIKRAILVRNECGQDADVYCAGDLSTVTIANGATALLYNDGTTVRNVAGGSSSGATTFTGLTDAPASYSGAALKQVRVNAGATGLEFVTPDSYIGISEKSDDYTLVAGDDFTLIAMNKATAVTLTVPDDASVLFPSGTQIYVMQLGAGQVTVAEGATSVQVMTVSTLKTFGQYSVVRLIKIDSDLWSIDGSLEGAAGVDTFVGRPDTPANYSGAANKLLAVNSGATAVEFIAAPYDIGTFCAGVPDSSELLLRFVAPRAFTLPAALTGSQVKAGIAATAATDFDVQRNGVSVGTISFAASGDSASFTFAVPVSFSAGDVLSVIAPSTADSTLADISFTFAGIRG